LITEASAHAAALDHSPLRSFTSVPTSGACRPCRGSAGWSDVPGGTGVGDAGAAEDSGSVDAPDIDLAAGILKQDVGFAVVVVVADPHDMPARPGVAEAAAADPGGAVYLPGHDFPIVVLP